MQIELTRDELARIVRALDVATDELADAASHAVADGDYDGYHALANENYQTRQIRVHLAETLAKDSK